MNKTSDFFTKHCYSCFTTKGGNTERFLNLCISNHILLFDTKKEANVFCAKVCTLRESKLKDLARKASVSITFSKRCGLFNDILLYKFRITFWIMPVLAALYFWIMSHYIWCVEIVGNSAISTEYLIEFINDAGIGYGALKDSIDEAQTEFMLRDAFPQITWVNVLLEGTHLCIHIKENDSIIYDTPPEETLSANLISEYDGEIVSIITRHGVPNAHIGDTVLAGDILVNGTVPIYNDYGDSIVSENYVVADADVLIKTTLVCTLYEPFAFQNKIYSGEESSYPFLLFENSIFSFYKGNEDGENSDVYTEYCQLCFGDDFFFPIYYGNIMKRDYYMVTSIRGEDELQEILLLKYDEYCNNLTAGDTRIVSDEIFFQGNDDGITLNAILTVICPAGYKEYYTLEDR